ncbi:MAG: membrane protein insertion efficiency factor YidD [Candidatus Saelkia tenebricola]|nr:membrane protein insertion efficiency factor YidD [Candidatus Saelkia tenebricola]
MCFVAKGAKRIVIILVKLYQKCFAPYMPYQCKYSPSCSEYCIAAVQKKGVWWGGISTAVRIMRCNPFSPGGYDPVR